MFAVRFNAIHSQFIHNLLIYNDIDTGHSNVKQ